MINKTKIQIIAEAGVNHNGDIALAKKLILSSKQAGADIVKFQIFNSKNFVSEKAKKAKYQSKNDKNSNQIEMLKKLELTRKIFDSLYSISKKNNIEFLASLFDFENFDVIKKYNFKRIKVPSGEINNVIYLNKISKFKLPLIISTGGSTLKEIERCLNWLIHKNKLSLNKITLLQCNSEYPTPFVDVNLRAMETLKKEFKTKVGISDHSLGIEVPIAAAALGASVIEKHITLNENSKGPDHSASLNSKDFKIMVEKIRNIEKAMGTGVKIISPSEKKNISLIRKSIFAKIKIKKGEYFNETNITLKRPAGGLPPIYWEKVINKKAKKYFRKDQMISLK